MSPIDHTRSRFKTPCNRLSKRDLQTTHHDPKDPNGGRMIELDDYLGIDDRGTNALSILRRSVYKRNTDIFGDLNGSGVGELRKDGRVKMDLKPGDEIGRRT